ncbi:MAG: glycerophosphoryl diester phosphodiesterase [Proteobacteria bacterium]|nr:glycerophosphoryl diester phosphodiesterase [Pseudomonadota bacterium]
MLKEYPWPVSKIIAHRGAAAFAPENTMASLKKAVAMGARWVEADVRLTLDDEVVVFHDAKLNRCTNGRGLVRKTPYSIIQGLDAGSWFDPHFNREKIPTLEQWLTEAAKNHCGVILDIKGTLFNTKRLVDRIVVILSQYWNANLPTPILSSESAGTLAVIAKQKLGYPLALIMNREYRGWQKVVARQHCISIHLNHEKISEAWIKKIKQLKLHIAAYTVNDPNRAQQLFDWGVDSIFTDNPKLLSGEPAAH